MHDSLAFDTSSAESNQGSRKAPSSETTLTPNECEIERRLERLNESTAEPPDADWLDRVPENSGAIGSKRG